ncbi:hypothetical protein MW887_008142 [Aspergillus wentii]|nr:hypothetical protein MW887_008142 [Aspergillus wentii]
MMLLVEELEKLYWHGVRRELENIISTLKLWQQEEYAEVNVNEENDKIHGFDTFVDGVCHQTRAFAIRYGEEKLKLQQDDGEDEDKKLTKLEKQLKRDSRIDEESKKIKSGVRKNLPTIPRYSGIEQRACMLLQAAGFLDIDKHIEHRPPLEKLGFWTRPAIPQLTLTHFEKDWTPQFNMLECSKCHSIIRGSMFVHIDKVIKQNTICEECYRLHYYGNAEYEKAYKHCILSETITPSISRAMCNCEDVPQSTEEGDMRALFPISRDEKHIEKEELQCKLLQLGGQVALAKYHGLQSIVQTQEEDHNKDTKSSSKLKSVLGIFNREHKEAKGRTKKITKLGSKKLTLQNVSETGRRSTPTKTHGDYPAATEAKADEDIPIFFRQFTEQYPFGNVHMALRVGPLVIENGVAHTKGGALISLRELPIFHERSSTSQSRQRSLAVSGDVNRYLWQQDRPAGPPKRYKAIMKQVVGGPFTGVTSRSTETAEEKAIIQLLVEASKKQIDDPGLSAADKKGMLDSALDPVMKSLKSLLQIRVRIYLSSIAARLIDPTLTTLTWSATSNNCQSFCNSLIDKELFEPLVSNHKGKEGFYLMSFFCPQEGYIRNKVHSKFDVPSGLTEEYLLRFHFGRHDDADVIDTLQEYWCDWGAFGSPLYKYQDLFPWDCTEAYGRYPTRCNDCNLAKHILAFPFDAWSIIQLHLNRDPHMYAPSSNVSHSWIENRLLILTASSILTKAAAAMAKTPGFCHATQWLHSEQSKLRRRDPSLTRVKLGGIHRAQPFSHYFEAGKYSHYFLAQWALRPRNEQIEEYELLRDGRVGMLDVGGGDSGKKSSNMDDAIMEYQNQLDLLFAGFDMDNSPNDTQDDQDNDDGNDSNAHQDNNHHQHHHTGTSGAAVSSGDKPDSNTNDPSSGNDQNDSHKGGQKSHSDAATTVTPSHSHAVTHSGKSHSGKDHSDSYSDIGSLSNVSYSGLHSGGHTSGYSSGYSGYSGGHSSSYSSSYSGGYSSSYSSGGSYSGGSSSYSSGGGSSSYSSGGGSSSYDSGSSSSNW